MIMRIVRKRLLVKRKSYNIHNLLLATTLQLLLLLIIILVIIIIILTVASLFLEIIRITVADFSWNFFVYFKIW
jgi:hypothetical protein